MVYNSFCHAQAKVSKDKQKKFKKPTDLYLVTEQNRVSGDMSNIAFFS